MLERIKRNKGIIILGAVVLVVLIISEIIGNAKRAQEGQISTPSPTVFVPGFQPGFKEPSYTQPALNQNGQVDLNSTQVKTAISQKTILAPQLPIYLEGFQTSSGITTTLNIYTISEDPDYLIHIEIYGIDYADQNITQDGNNNGIAFADSFNKIKSLLVSAGVDIHKIYFIFGAKPYIQITADDLIKKYKLL